MHIRLDTAKTRRIIPSFDLKYCTITDQDHTHAAATMFLALAIEKLEV